MVRALVSKHFGLHETSVRFEICPLFNMASYSYPYQLVQRCYCDTRISWSRSRTKIARTVPLFPRGSFVALQPRFGVSGACQLSVGRKPITACSVHLFRQSEHRSTEANPVEQIQM